MTLRIEQLNENKGPVLRLSGAFGRDGVKAVSRALAQRRPVRGGVLTLDLGGITKMDSAAVATLVLGWRRAQAVGATVRVGTLSTAAREALSMFRVEDTPPDSAKPVGLFEALGGALVDTVSGFRDFLQLSADTSFAVAHGLLRPRTVRWSEVVAQFIYIGSQALPIVLLITFLIGLTVAFQSAHQLRQFGAAIFVADLTAVSMTREMGPLMTAILVAGRSGASIAAEVATMKVQEEVDALQVMGLEPVRFLAVPRVIAITLMIPLLTVLADLVGILGGFVVGLGYLDISWTAYLNETLHVLGPWDLGSGLLKSVVFGAGIGMIGLYFGFRVRGGAGAVGRTTTASVVASIFFIIVADLVFSILFYVVL